MCGRFTLTIEDYASIVKTVGAIHCAADAEMHRPRYNVAPSDAHPVVCATPTGGRALVPARWGLPRGQQGLHINIRIETAHERSSFRNLTATGRCAVLSDGFYEWSGPPWHRQPHWFHTGDRSLMAFGGLFRDTKDPQTGEVNRRFAILTTESNTQMAPYHTRMPFVVRPGDLEDWLMPATQGHQAYPIKIVQRSVPNDFFDIRPVSPRVNGIEHDDAACIEPAMPPKQRSFCF